MFEIDAQNLPVVQTRQALLLLDLQNDFISTGAILPVETPSDFVENILKLVPEFRDPGSIIWIRSVFEASRAINEGEGESESVITDRELPVRSRGGNCHLLREPAGPSQKLIETHERVAEANGTPMRHGPTLSAEFDGEDAGVEETYLTIDEGQHPQVVLSKTLGANFSEAVSRCIDERRDMIYEKSAYSSFKDGKLVQMLRARFVTGIYICGALTNISVFATAMDAARHGYEIALVDDCLGYRSKARHDEALRKVVEFTGCDIINSKELVEELKRKSQRQQASTRDLQRRPPGQYLGLESLMANLTMRPDRHQATVPRTITGSSIVATAESFRTEDEDESLNLPVQVPRPEKKKRTKARIRTRRRHPISAPKDIPKSTDEDIALSPTATTLRAESRALGKVPSSDKGPSTASTPEILATSLADMTMELRVKENGQVPDELLKSEEKTPVEPKLTPLCEGDTIIIPNLLDDDLARNIFEKIRDEVLWQKMSHQGGDVPRLVAVQGEVAEDGSVPIYRHPADESPQLLLFSTNVSLIRSQVEKKLGHTVNHVLIQFYRDGTDHISEHSDKTLDIVPRTCIANVSLGAQRTMVFRTKKPPKTVGTPNADIVPRQSCRAVLPHNSMCRMGLVTNMRWLHAIRQDKRMTSEKSDAELAFKGGRISLTFRSIGTYLDKDQQKIWGQGATSKIKEDARNVVSGDSIKSEQMIRAFGKENHSSEFDWKESYGEGFDVLHISNSSKLFLSGDFVADARVKLLLAECEIPWSEGMLSPSFNWKSDSLVKSAAIPELRPVKFVDNDLSKSTVTGDLAILLYLGAVHSSKWTDKSQVDLARQYTRLQQCEEVLKKWRAVPSESKPFCRELEMFEAYANEAEYIAGSTVSLADFALWPILYEVNREFQALPNLVAYYERMEARESVRKVFPKDELSMESEDRKEVKSKDEAELGGKESERGLEK